jgi:hypothetical protein
VRCSPKISSSVSPIARSCRTSASPLARAASASTSIFSAGSTLRETLPRALGVGHARQRRQGWERDDVLRFSIRPRSRRNRTRPRAAPNRASHAPHGGRAAPHG